MAVANFFADNKTSKMLILETCVKRKLAPPTWETSQLQSSPPVFTSKCNVRLGNDQIITGEGYGSNKRDSEQCAALKTVAQLLSTQEFMQATFMWKEFSQEENQITKSLCSLTTAGADPPEDDCVSDTDDDDTTENTTGKLLTLCAKSKLPPPDIMESSRAVGLQKKLKHIVTVKVGTLSCVTVERWKKQDSKRIAALRVLKELNSLGYQSVTKPDKSNKNAVLVTSPNSSTDDVTVTSSQAQIESPKTAESGCSIKLELCSNSTSACSEQPNPLPHGCTKRGGLSSNNSNDELKNESRQTRSEVSRELFNLKRKNYEEKYDVPMFSCSIKREYELYRGHRLICSSQIENCLRYVKDCLHVFQHIPPNPLDQILMPKEFEHMLSMSGGPFKLLETSAVKLHANIVLPRTSVRLNIDSERNELVILVLRFQDNQDFKGNFVKRYAFAGTGIDFNGAKEDAALNALIHLRKMMFCEEDC